MNLTQNHADIAWANFLAQYGESPRLEAVVRALYAPAQELQNALRALYDERWLDTAVGAQLDGIGEIVAQPRTIPNVIYVEFFGFDGQPGIAGFGEARIRRHEEPHTEGSTTLLDAEYRKVLYWKIAINNGHGTAPEIAAAMRVIFDASSVVVQDRGNAKIGIWINTTPETNPAMMVNPLLWVPKLAGVGVELVGNEDLPFGFVNQGYYGFGVGRMVSSLT